MPKVLLLADDCTGALDAGARLCACGLSVRVLSSMQSIGSWRDYLEDVLSIDMDSRHLLPAAAKELVYRLVLRGRDAGIEYFYKKTDSALRGNIGAELAGIADAAGTANGITFVPAYPENHRIVSDGILYIEGVPVADTFFGEDPFTPVCHSAVEKIIKEQTDIPVEKVKQDQYQNLTLPFGTKAIRIVDAETEKDVITIGNVLKGTKNAKFLAGCAGFAVALPAFVESVYKPCVNMPEADGLLVISGSLHPTTLDQINTGERLGFKTVTLTPEQKIEERYPYSDACAAFTVAILKKLKENKRVILCAARSKRDAEDAVVFAKSRRICLENLRMRVSENISVIVQRILREARQSALTVLGGDTLHMILEKAEVRSVIPVREIAGGTIASVMESALGYRQLISKSGGLGSPDILEKIDTYLQKGGKLT